MSLVIITGQIDCGKTTWCRERLLVREGSWDGILCLKVLAAGRRVGYDALRFCGGESLPLLRCAGCEPPGWEAGERVGIFSASVRGLRTANRWLREAARGPAAGLLIDELGPLELAGGGLAQGVRFALGRTSPSRTIYLVVRGSCLELINVAFGLRGAELWRIEAGRIIPEAPDTGPGSFW